MKPKRSYLLRWAKHQKRWFAKWHVYLGIIAGLVIVVVGLTGSILTFQDEIDIALNKNLFEVNKEQHKIPLEDIIPLVKEKYPSMVFDYAMDDADKPHMAYRFYNFTTEQEFFVNPYTAGMSGKRLYQSSFIRIVMNIHTSLLLHQTGEYITGTASLILLILTISGLRLWIPRKWKQLKSVLTVRFKGSFKRQNYDWHNVIGFHTSPVVVYLALTGICITFSVIIVPMLFILSGRSPQGIEQIFSSKSVYQKNRIALSPEKAAEIVYREMLGSRIEGMGLPNDSTGVYRFDILSPGLPEGGKREMLVIDQYSGHIILNSRNDFPHSGEAYLAWLQALHYGSFGGLPTKILACLGGLSPLALFVTGFIIWYPRWRKQKKAGNRPLTKEEDETILYADEPLIASVPKDISILQYFVQQLKKGLHYALWVLLITAVMGILYGIISGIIMQPAVFGIVFTTILIVINFAVAILCFFFNLIFLAPFGKGSRMLVRYFSLSLGFCSVFLICYFLLMHTGMHIF